MMPMPNNIKMNIEIRDFIVDFCPICGTEPTIQTSVKEDITNPWHVYCDNECYHGRPAEVWEDDLLTALERWKQFCLAERRKMREESTDEKTIIEGRSEK